MKKRIFLLEDDTTLNETVVEFLEDNDFDVISSYDGEDAYEIIYEKSFDLLLLDVNVPSMSGFELLKKLRSDDVNTPAIYITSLNSIESFEEGFENGCDDYIRKPFELKELLIRIHSILKRSYFHNRDEKVKLSQNLEFDISKNIVYKEGIELKINNKEIKLLNLFLQNKDEIISHEKIMSHLWEYDEVASDLSLRTYIKNLRKILGKERILSVKKLGYRYTSE